MPSAQKTPYYGLTHYAADGSDKVSFLGDYNTDMGKIDAGLNNHDKEIAAKANAADVYTKTQVDSSQSAQDATIAAKANSADVYTKTQVDSSQSAQDATIAAKANSSDVYTKTQVDSSQSAQDATIATKANATDVYTKTQSDASYASLTKQTNVKKDLLFAHFSSRDERLFLGISHDGYRFEDFPFAYSSPDGTVRDPSIAIINNEIYVVHTLHSSSGNEQYAIGLAVFGLDLNLISHTVVTPSVSGDRAWAPEFFCDPVTGNWYIVCALRTDGNFHPYYSSLATPNSFSPMSTNNAISGIDWSVQVNNGVYYLLGAGNGSMVVYTSTSWPNFANAPVNTLPKLSGRSLEGFTAFRIDNGNWRVVGDAGGFVTPMQSDSELYYFDMTSDFSEIVSPYKHLDARGRHGTIIPLTVSITSSFIPQRSASTTYIALNDQQLSSMTNGPDWTIIPWDAQPSAPNYGSPAANIGMPTTVLSVTEAGLYLLSCYVAFKDIANSVMPLIGVSINGDFSKVTVGAYTAQIPNGPGDVGGGFTIPMQLKYGDAVRIGCQNKATGTQGACRVYGGVSFVSLTKIG